MLYLGSAAWMLCMALMSDRPRIRDHTLTLGLGLGALLAGLLIAVPAAGTALATLFSGFGSRGLLNALVVTQVAWIAVAAFGIAGYSLSRVGRRLRSARAAVLEVIGVGAAVALVPASARHLSLVIVLVPAAAAAVAATLLGGVERPVAVLAGVLATAAFVVVFAVCRAFPSLGLAELLLGTGALAYAVGRLTDLHPASAERPSLILGIGLVCGFVLVYKL